MDFNNIIDGLNTTKTVPAKKNSPERKEGCLLEFVFFLGCAIAVFGDRRIFVFLRNIYRAVYNRVSAIHKMALNICSNGFRSIRLCILEFLNPLQKMLFNRADEFDIAHIIIYSACRSVIFKPHFSIR